MKCLHCDYPDSQVVSTTYNNDKQFIYRRRECIKCGNRYTTRENYRDDYKIAPYKTTGPVRILPK